MPGILPTRSFAQVISTNGSVSGAPSLFNRRLTRMSDIQRHLQAKGATQAEILQQLSKTNELAIVTCATGDAGHYEVLHHISTEESAGVGGLTVRPTVYCGVGLRETALASWSANSKGSWNVLRKSTNARDTATVPDILQALSQGELSASAADTETAAGDSLFMPSFIILNGRALEELDKEVDKSYLSLVLALARLVRADLEEECGEDFVDHPDGGPTAADLAQRSMNDNRDPPYAAQLQVAYAWLRHATSDQPKGFSVLHEDEMTTGMRAAYLQWQRSFAALPGPGKSVNAAQLKRPPEEDPAEDAEMERATKPAAESEQDPPAQPDAGQPSYRVGQSVVASVSGIAYFGTITNSRVDGQSQWYSVRTTVQGMTITLDNVPQSSLQEGHQSPAGKGTTSQPERPSRSPPSKRSRLDLSTFVAPDTTDATPAASGRTSSIRRETGPVEPLRDPPQQQAATNLANPYRRGAGSIGGQDRQEPPPAASDATTGLFETLAARLLDRMERDLARDDPPPPPPAPGAAGGAVGQAGDPIGGTDTVADRDFDRLLAIHSIRAQAQQARETGRLGDNSARQTIAIEESNRLHAEDADLQRRGAKAIVAPVREFILRVATTTGHSPATSMQPLLRLVLGKKDKNEARHHFNDSLRGNEGRQEAHISKEATTALTTGDFVTTEYEPSSLGYYTVSHEAFEDSEKFAVVTTTTSLVKLAKAVLKTFKQLFGPSGYPTIFATKVLELVDKNDGRIDAVMTNFSAPDLVAHLQWLIESSWTRYLLNCKGTDMAYSPLQLETRFETALASPSTLNQPTTIKTLVAAAGGRARPPAPTLPPPSLPPPPQPRPPPFQPPYQPNPYQPQQPQRVFHDNQPNDIACNGRFFSDVIHDFGIALIRQGLATCPKLSDGKDDCLKFSLRGTCLANCPRADPRQGGTTEAHSPVVPGTTRHTNLVAFKQDCLTRQREARARNPALPDFR